MKKIIRSTVMMLMLGLLLVAVNFGGSGGCTNNEGSATGGNGDDDDGSDDSDIDVGTGTGQFSIDTGSAGESAVDVGRLVIEQMFTTASALVLLDMNQDGEIIDIEKEISVDESVTCTSGGPATVTGTATDGTFSLEIELNGCDGLDGPLTLEGSWISAEGTLASYNATMSGTIGGFGCTVTISSLSIELAESSEIATGTITGSCEDTIHYGFSTTACTWSGITDEEPDCCLNAECT